MEINTGFGVAWIDRMTGFKLHTIGDAVPETEDSLQASKSPMAADAEKAVSAASL